MAAPLRNLIAPQSVVGLLVAAFGFGLVGSAKAAPVQNGAVQHQITNAMNQRLINFGVRLDGVNAVRLANGRIGMQVRSGDLRVETNQPGPYDPVQVTKVNGWVTMSGRFRFQRWQWVRAGNGKRRQVVRRSVLMTLGFNFDKGLVRGKFGQVGAVWNLMRINRSQLRYGGTPENPTISNIRLSLHGKANHRLNGILRTNAFTRAPQFAIAAVTAQLPSGN